MASTVFNGKIYVLGGTCAVEVYDPSINTWTVKSNMSLSRYDLTAETIGDKIYIIDGHIYGGIPEDPPPVYDNVEEYNPLTDTWKLIGNMPPWRYEFSSSCVEGKIYVIGGSNPLNPLNTVEELIIP